MTVYLGKKPVGVTKVVKKEVAKTKFGANVDTWVGDVDENGALQKPTWTGALNFAGVKEIAYRGLRYAFYHCEGITSADFSSVRSVDENGMYNTFVSCSNLASVDLSSLQNIGDSGLNTTFYNCTALTKISFPALTSVQTNSLGSSTVNSAFRGCTALTEIHFRADMQATIEAMSQYAKKWGAPATCSILFDL